MTMVAAVLHSIMVRALNGTVLTAAICSYDDTIAQGASRTRVTFSSPAHGIHQRAQIIITITIMTSQSVIINKQRAC